MTGSIAIDIVGGTVGDVSVLRGSEPLVYVLAFENGTVADVTKRYAERWSQSWRLVGDPEWWSKTLSAHNAQRGSLPDGQIERILVEQREFDGIVEAEPFPTAQDHFRKHPLYVLEKYVGKYDILWPPDQPALGFFKNMPIYPRKNVYHLHTREKWIQHGRQIKDGETSVKSMKKIAYKKSKETVTESEYFGEWQTEPYQPPDVENVRLSAAIIVP